MGLKDKVLVAWHNCGLVRVPRHFGKESTTSEYLDEAYADAYEDGHKQGFEDGFRQADKDLPMIEQAVRRSEDANRQADELGGRI